MSESSQIKRQFDRPTKWQPRNTQLLLVPTVEDERSAGGIVIPESVRRKTSSGFVAKKGSDADPDIQIGDEVFFEQHSQFSIVLDDNEEEAYLVACTNLLLVNPATPTDAQPAN